MNPVLDKSASGSNGNVVGTLSYSMPISNLGATGLLVVGIESKFKSGHTPGYASSVTYNGVALTAIKQAQSVASATTAVELWGLRGTSIPTAGTYTVGIGQSQTADGIVSGAMSFFNIKDQAAEATASATANGNVPFSTSITTLTNNALIVAIYGAQNGDTVTWSSPATSVYSSGASPENSTSSGAYQVLGVAGSQSVQVSMNNPEAEALLLASFASVPQTTKLGLGKYW